MNANLSPYQNEVFFEKIKKMTDEQILTVIKNQGDYNSTFIEMVKEEIGLRGYNFSIDELNDIDLILIKHKSTEDLVDIYVNPTDFNKKWELLAQQELSARNYDISALYIEKQNGLKILKQGIQGSHIILGYFLAVLGGIIGLIMALNYMNKKISTISGEKLYKYNETTRQHGKVMLIVWSIVNIIVGVKIFS
ncbi:conserved hypothetical protein [uncultured Paludibacter sp.]|nr:conserved hypothetical protein [uncultured Paludibacter sp.]